MKTQAGKILRFATLLSTFVVLWLWIASFWSITWRASHRNALRLDSGVFSYWRNFPTPGMQQGLSRNGFDTDLDWWIPGSNFVIYNVREFPMETTRYLAIHVPLWIPWMIGLTCCLATWLPHQARRRRIRLQGQRPCVQCGYDLRAMTEKRCPECGKLL